MRGVLPLDGIAPGGSAGCALAETHRRKRLVVSAGDAMRVLGIDPGSHVTGWGVIESSGSRFAHVASGAIRGSGHGLAQRLEVLADGLEVVLQSHGPAAVSVETVFFAKNSQSALKLGHARGVALLCAARFGAPVFEYTAGQIKQATTGRGRASKDQVQTMVRLLLGLAEPLQQDQSDALAAAICHAQMRGTQVGELLAGAAHRLGCGPGRAGWERR